LTTLSRIVACHVKRISLIGMALGYEEQNTLTLTLSLLLPPRTRKANYLDELDEKQKTKKDEAQYILIAKRPTSVLFQTLAPL